jgi:hypothetical protein
VEIGGGMNKKGKPKRKVHKNTTKEEALCMNGAMKAATIVE